METSRVLVAQIRSSIREHLQLLSDLSAQCDYERNVPIAMFPRNSAAAGSMTLTDQRARRSGRRSPWANSTSSRSFNALFAAALVELPDPLPSLSELSGGVQCGAAS